MQLSESAKKKIADLEWYRRSHANTDEYVDKEVAKITAADARHQLYARFSDVQVFMAEIERDYRSLDPTVHMKPFESVASLAKEQKVGSSPMESYYRTTSCPNGRDSNGWLQASYKLPPCGCEIVGNGTSPQPLRIVFCAAHRESVR